MKSYYIAKSTMPFAFGGCKSLNDIIDVAQNIVLIDDYLTYYIDGMDRLTVHFVHLIPGLSGVWELEKIER